MKRTFIVVIAILSCLFVGFVASRLQAESVAEWYPLLNKSLLTPPDSVFPIAWTILYILMGISVGLVVCSCSIRETLILKLFTLQIALNFLWSVLFFYFRSPVLGLVDILLLDIVLVVYMVKAYSEMKISSYLFIPYFLWVAFATYLNLYIVLYN